MDRVKIGPLSFRIQYSNSPKNDKGEDVDGNLLHNIGIIQIDALMSEDAKLQTILHEIVHEKLEIQCGHDLKEGLVDAIAFSWLEVMRDNPELVKMITK
jgi:hypothetical protein